ncbi:MAG: DUF1566 domain-containing protein [Deltaproteobacteria bacterium]|nr:DUF1566 domain-containing protein [Deltaproteobacteria bacterium]
MGLFQKIGFTSDVIPAIDWQLIPAETFGIFESWGGRERVKSAKERFYYFFIDTWEEPATLCLMERGIKFARVLARIAAPQELIDNAVKNQGKTMGLDKSYAIDDTLKTWLIKNVVDTDDDSLVIPIETVLEKESMETGLPGHDSELPESLTRIALNSNPLPLQEKEMPELIRKGNFFDTQHNPAGRFTNYLVDNQDGLTVTDKVTGIMWQRRGCDITSIRKIQNYIQLMNSGRLAGYNDWRLPTIEEALSLMEPALNTKGLYLHQCFSAEQPFIFLAGRREPGGYWFCDFKQGTVYWASGTIPGGFGRLCRKV